MDAYYLYAKFPDKIPFYASYKKMTKVSLAKQRQSHAFLLHILFIIKVHTKNVFRNESLHTYATSVPQYMT